MSPKTAKPLRLRHLKVQNFKVLDRFEMEFPPPEFEDDPDVVVLGSRNGMGKTSVLECCCLSFLAGVMPEALARFLSESGELPDRWIRVGTNQALIEGGFAAGPRSFEVQLQLEKNHSAEVAGDFPEIQSHWQRLTGEGPANQSARNGLLKSLLGSSPEPLLFPGLTYFHSYRKVREGDPSIGMMIGKGGESLGPGAMEPVSTFKLLVLHSMMSQAGLFEEVEDAIASEVLSTINRLIRRYANGRLSKLRPSPDNTVDLRIAPDEGGDSYSFDSLSSGQKEIISTMFLLWHLSLRYPGMVLVDEPELHLNAEWHQSFVAEAFSLAPRNQYILATHSKDIVAAVPGDRRFLLEITQKAAG